jgi:hypothetical protein
MVPVASAITISVRIEDETKPRLVFILISLIDDYVVYWIAGTRKELSSNQPVKDGAVTIYLLLLAETVFKL